MLNWKEKPLLRSTDAYIGAENTRRFLEGSRRVLLVGDAGGRDWTYLSRHGHELHVLDIAPQAGIPNVTVQSIEKRTPFEDGFFDAVVLNEVLEHLFYDVSALDELHRILRKDGVLVLSVPYLSRGQDDAEYHVRVHSPRTVRRLLEKCGFSIEVHFCRGFAARLPQSSLAARAALYALQRAAGALLRRDPDASADLVNGTLNRLEIFVGSHRSTAGFQRLFPSYGGVIKARRVDARRDFDALQVESFGRP